jgi:hypothetical protein
MKKYLAVALVVAVLAGVTSVFASENIWGRVEKIDTTNNSISAWNGQNGNFTIKLNDTSKVTKDGSTVALKDIPVGSHIEGSATKQSDGVYLGESLAITGGRNGGQTCNGLGGRIQSIDVSTRTVTLACARNGTLKVTLNSDAKITVNGKDAKIDELKANYMAWFEGTKNSDGTYTATSLDAKEGNGCGRGNGGGCRGGNGGGCRGKGRN